MAPIKISDIDGILYEMEAPWQLSAAAKQKVTEVINKEWANHQDRLKVRESHKRARLIQDWKRVGKLSGELIDLVRNMPTEVAFAADDFAGILLPPPGVLNLPSSSALRWVDQLIITLQCLEKIAPSAVSREALIGLGSKKDLLRYGFVWVLAMIYKGTFKKKPLTTVGGSWIFFLSKILSILEDEPLSCDGARDLWIKVRRLGVSRGLN